MTAGHEHGFRRKAVQAKDVSNLQALEAVWMLSTGGRGVAVLTELQAQFKLPTWKLIRAKMEKLLRQGFVDGCACGCAGCFKLTPSGCAELSRLREVEASRAALGGTGA